MTNVDVTRDAPEELAARVTDELLAYIEQQRMWIEHEAQPLLDELASLVASGGKRLRPRFCYWGHRAAGGDDSAEIVRVGAALELLHTMALIHDDVMDAAVVRRSRPSTAATFATIAASVRGRGDPHRFGGSAAILTGMLGFVLADRLFVQTDFDATRKARAADRYDALRSRAIAGQYLDLLSAYRGSTDEATARRIASLKSGAYSVADPLAIGALLAGDDTTIVDALERYGRPLGEAFQIRDDILGTFGDPAVTGKDRNGDLREGKQTVLLAKACAKADDQQLALLDASVGDPALTEEEADLLRDVIVATGALDETELLVAALAGEAKTALTAAPLDRSASDALVALADEATTRVA